MKLCSMVGHSWLDGDIDVAWLTPMESNWAGKCALNVAKCDIWRFNPSGMGLYGHGSNGRKTHLTAFGAI
jgi:hypothetical protein